MIGSVRSMPHIINICILIKSVTKLIGILERKVNMRVEQIAIR